MIRMMVMASFLIVSDCGLSVNSGNQCAFEHCYRVTFFEVWDAANFPTRFPANAHFSPLIGSVHGPAADFFELNQGASAGIEAMAETGSTLQLRNEIQQAINAGTARSVISGPGIASNANRASVEFAVTNAYSLVTLVSMVAPSPDWFVGVDSINLKDASGRFRDSLIVDLVVYDAGSDQGVSFTSPNAEDNGVITRLSCADLVNHCGFSDGLGSDGVAHIGSFVFEKISDR